jgi:PAS domain S-box-containing protein
MPGGILIVDDHEIVRRGLRTLLGSRPEWEICGEAGDGLEAVEKAKRLLPDVVLMDVSMPRMDGLEATKIIRQELPLCKVVIISQNDPLIARHQAREVGASGYVVKSEVSKELLTAISRFMDGRNGKGVSAEGVSSENPAVTHWPAGGGEMGRLIREHDWSQTPLGAIGGWPQSLKTAINLILNSQHPMWIGWGADATFLYNDAYIQVLSLAKHPQALGRPAAEVWGEIWDICGPLADKVFQKGEASFVDEVRLFMNRGDYLEETYYSFSYSPIRGESGDVAGLFCPSTEVTPKVINARRLATLAELSAHVLVQKTTEAACASAIDTLARNADDVPFAILYLIGGEDKKARLERICGLPAGIDSISRQLVEADGTEQCLWPIAQVLKGGHAQVISVEGVEGLPRGLADQQLSQAIVLPVASRGEDHTVGVLVAGVNPARKVDAEYRTFYELVAAQIATAIQNARASEGERKRLEALAEIDRASNLLAAIVDSSDDAIISKSLDGVITSWNMAAERVFGHTAKEAIGRHITLIIPLDRRNEEVEIIERIRRGERIDHFETVRMRKDGTLLDIALTISPVKDGTGKIVGASKVARDITERERAAERERQITAEAVAATAKFRAVFEQTTVFAGIMDIDGTFIDANQLCLQVCGYRAEDVLGKPFWQTGWWQGSKEVQDKIRAATIGAAEGTAYRETLTYYWADGSEHLVDFSLHPIRDHEGKILFLHPTGIDITELKQAEEKYRLLAESLDADVRVRTRELEQRNVEVVQQAEQLRDLSSRLLQAQDEERRHIARELHDSAGQILAALGMTLGQAVTHAKGGGPQFAKCMGESQQLVQQLSQEIRTMSYLLHPPLLDETGLSGALHWYMQGLAERNGLEITLDVPENFTRLSREMELVMFRLVQECLTNIHRHSESKNARIRIARDNESVSLEVQDEGKGISAQRLAQIQSQGSGVGIRGMRERVRHFGGNMKIESNGAGTKISFEFPVSRASDDSGADALPRYGVVQ